MTNAVASSGTKLYISAAETAEPADAAAYAALSWTEVARVESLGEYGDEASILTASALGDARVFKAKGPRDAGTLVVTCLDIGDDPGQLAMVAGEGTNFSYPFKVVLPNRLTVLGTDEVDYFIGLVSSKRLTVGDNTNFLKRTFNVAINSKITQVVAT